MSPRLPPDVEPVPPLFRYARRADRVKHSAGLLIGGLFASGGVGFAFAASPILGVVAGLILLAVIVAFVWWVET